MSQIVKGNFPYNCEPNSSWPSSARVFLDWPKTTGSRPITGAEAASIMETLTFKAETESTAFATGDFDPQFWRGFKCSITGVPDTVPEPLLVPLRHKRTLNSQRWANHRKGSDIVIGDYAQGSAIVTQFLGTEIITENKPFGYISISTFNIGYEVSGTSFSHYVNFPGIGWINGGSFKLNYSRREQISAKSPESAGFSTIGIQKALISYTGLAYDNGLITQVLARANQGDLDLLTFYAELPETVRSFYDLLKKLIKIATEMKNKEFRLYNQLKARAKNKKVKTIIVNGVELFDEIASLRLRYRYEILPLVGALTDLGLSLQAPIRLFQTTKKRSPSVPEPFGFSGWISQDGDIKKTDRAWCKRAFAIDENTQFTRAFSQDLAVTAFELITGSFILDWAFNFGDVIAALNLFSAEAHSNEGFTFSSKFEGIAILQPIGIDNKIAPTVKIELQSYERKVINPREHICVIPENGLFGNARRELDLLAFAWISFSSRFGRK